MWCLRVERGLEYGGGPLHPPHATVKVVGLRKCKAEDVLVKILRDRRTA